MRSGVFAVSCLVLAGCSSEPEPAASPACVPLDALTELPPLGARRCEGLRARKAFDPSKPGPYPVGVSTLAITDPLRPGRTLTTEVWYPAAESARGQDGATCFVIQTSAVRDAPRAASDPTTGLVVFSHGYRGLRCQSTFLTIYLASHGYVVAAPDHPGNTLGDPSASDEQAAVDRVLDMSVVTSELIRKNESAGDFFHASFDSRRVAWTGHSFGASTVLMAGAAENREIVNIPLAPAFDDRMGLVYAPSSYDLRAATLVVGGTDDGTEPISNQELAYERSVAPRFLAKIAGAKHFDFTDLCATPLAGVQQIGSECGPDPEAAHAAVNTVVSAALARYLSCDPDAASWLEPGWLAAHGSFADVSADPAPAANARESRAVCDLDARDAAPLQESTIERGDAPSLHLASRGADPSLPPIVFIHGFSTSGAVFAHQLERLSARFRAIALDLRGHGGSATDPTAPFGPDGAPGTSDDPYTLAHFADDVEASLDHEALARPVLVGWSSGAQVALEVARRRGSALRGLVLIDGAPLTQPDLVLHPDYNGGETLEFAHALGVGLAASDQGEDTWRPLVQDFFAPGSKAELVDPMMAEFLAISPDTRRGQIGSGRPDLVAELPKIAVPTLVIHGEQDDALLLESARYVLAHIPGATLSVFQSSGHAPFLEEPGRFDQELARFVDGLPP